jgi:hypothetical protein
MNNEDSYSKQRFRIHWNRNEEPECEVKGLGIEHKFCDTLAKYLAETLVPENTGIVTRLLSDKLVQLLCYKEGLLEQYLHSQLEEIAEEFRRDFKLSNDESQVDYKHATHAKLYTIIHAILSKYKIELKEKE